MSHHFVALVVATMILGSPGGASAQSFQPDPPLLRVLVIDETGVRAEVLSAAEEDASAIYAAAGVQIVWLHPMPEVATDRQLDLTVKIRSGIDPVMTTTAANEHTLGFAVVSPERTGQRGRLVWVYYDQIEKYAAQRHVSVKRLCAMAIAHEIGHLFLPAGHSKSGLMGGTWELRSGLLEYFTAEQERTIRTRISLSSCSVASSTVAYPSHRSTTLHAQVEHARPPSETPSR